MAASGSIRLTVDTDLCLGARQCSFVAPAVFDHEEDGTAVVTDVSAVDESVLLEAARICPNFAITLEIDGEIVHQGG